MKGLSGGGTGKGDGDGDGTGTGRGWGQAYTRGIIYRRGLYVVVETLANLTTA